MSENNERQWSDSIVVAARSDVGMRRSNNQDSFRVALAASPRLWKERGHVFVVADGMGAHAAGELASKIAATSIPQAYLKATEKSPPDALRDAFAQAHEEIRRRGSVDDAFHDMGTTCDALVVLPEGALIGHVGDSRVYRVRDRVVEQLTFDHSLLWEVKFSAARPTEKQLANIPKNVITRSLGPTDSLVVDLEGPIPLKPGDAFLLCSDGVSGQFDDTELGQILDIFQPEEAAETLINLANLRGGPDNATVVVVRFKKTPNLDELEKEIEKESKFLRRKEPLSALAWTALAPAVASPAIGAALWTQIENKALLAIGTLAATLFFAGLFLWFGRKRFFAKRAELGERVFGKGPYVRASAAANAVFCEKVADVCDQLCDAVLEQRLFAADWKGVSNAREQANAALKAFDFASSLRANISVVNYMMRELKKVRRPD